MSDICVLAPHPDDEIIGCYSIFRTVDTIIYFDMEDSDREIESRRFCDTFSIDMMHESVEAMINGDIDFDYWSTVYAPDPFTEHHPLHRAVGMAAWVIYYTGNIDSLHLYSTDMTPPWIREIDDFKEKHEMLDRFYPSQKSLWQNDFKYYFFEGDLTWPESG